MLELHGHSASHVKLEKDGQGVEFLGDRQLLEYEILQEAAVTTSQHGISQLEIVIVFRRRIEFHLANTFLQTIMLIFVGYLSLFFDTSNFTDRIMVALTTMLVLATFTSSIQAVIREIKTLTPVTI